MAKRIVICTDGTGNRGGRNRGTNVWRIFNSVDRYSNDCKQITYYDDGVGSDKFRLFRLIGGAFGIGLSRKIRDAYTFLVVNYEEGDRIFMFGFSRGAFTVRSLAGMICRCGLLQRKPFLASRRQARKRSVQRILDAYRSEREMPGSEGEDGYESDRIRRFLGIGHMPLRMAPVHFVGIWDTVDAVGGTFGSLTILDRLWRRLFKKRWWGFHDLDPHPEIRHAYQALALDDERRTYHPKIWDRSNNDLAQGMRRQPGCRSLDRPCKESAPDQIIEQVWFAGAHSNVGGGYPKDSLSLVPLYWMMCRAQDCGLHFLRSRWAQYRESADPHGRLYDSRSGLAAFYRYARRRVHCNRHVSAIHESVLERAGRGTDFYAPKIIGNEGYVVVLNDVRFER